MRELLIARYVLLECVRRRVFLVVPILSVAFLGLYWFAVARVFAGATSAPGPVDEQLIIAATMLGLGLFGSFFLGVVLIVFLTFTVARGDAEQGLLQPVVVRPLGRRTFLLGRFLGAAVVSMIYVIVLFACCVLITRGISGWSPRNLLQPALELAGAVALVGALTMLGSVFLSTIANGVTALMMFGTGLIAGLIGQIGEGLDSPSLVSIAGFMSWALPFEALYQSSLASLTEDIAGLSGFLIQLGPFGGAQESGPGLYAWAAVYLVAVGWTTIWSFRRRDL
jgi:ABC-type transport system involved in multi-copper enzyme maturation permease subunit